MPRLCCADGTVCTHLFGIILSCPLHCLLVCLGRIMASALVRAIKQLDGLAELVKDTIGEMSPSQHAKDTEKMLLDIIAWCRKALMESFKKIRSGRHRRQLALHKFRQLNLKD